MNLYRLIVLNTPNNLERGVWAKEVTVRDGIYYFKVNCKEKDYLIASYPADITIITSIETDEEHEAAKKKKEEALKEMEVKIDYTDKKW